MTTMRYGERDRVRSASACDARDGLTEMRPNFTKKHYERIAGVLRLARWAAQDRRDWPALAVLDDVEAALAREFVGDNPRFDPARFHEAAHYAT